MSDVHTGERSEKSERREPAEPILRDEIGIIRKVIAKKGYGFIQPRRGGNDIFMHDRALQRTDLSIERLQEGDEVRYDVVPNRRRAGEFEAANIHKTGITAPQEPAEHRPYIVRHDVRGTVKWFSPEKGYGFITDDQEKDIFVHVSAVIRSGISLEPQMPVIFDQERKGQKTSAVHLRPV
jgi:CspA family cold shock protein